MVRVHSQTTSQGNLDNDIIVSGSPETRRRGIGRRGLLGAALAALGLGVFVETKNAYTAELAEAEERGRQKAYDEGHAEGSKEGYDKGVKAGQEINQELFALAWQQANNITDRLLNPRPKDPKVVATLWGGDIAIPTQPGVNQALRLTKALVLGFVTEGPPKRTAPVYGPVLYARVGYDGTLNLTPVYGQPELPKPGGPYMTVHLHLDANNILQAQTLTGLDLGPVGIESPQ
jgi:hypothetical protein